jgi:hypothetical protein
MIKCFLSVMKVIHAFFSNITLYLNMKKELYAEYGRKAGVPATYRIIYNL